jgi:hypothetical protein
MRNAAGELHHLDAARHFAQRIIMGLAVFGGNRAGDVVGMGGQQFLERNMQRARFSRRHVAPGRQGRLGRGNRLVRPRRRWTAAASRSVRRSRD